MLKVGLSVLVLVGVCLTGATRGATIEEDFATDPSLNGWQVFGGTNLFLWNATNGNLEVTWDSREPNSYFYHALGGEFTRHDDLSLEFDLELVDITSGVEPGKTGPLQLGFGFLNYTTATSTNFMRGVWGGAPNVAEFDYYPSGYYDFGGVIWDIAPTTTPCFISGVDSFHYAPAFLTAYERALPTNQAVHVRLDYDGATQTATLALTTNGVPLALLPGLVLNSAANSQFTSTDDFRVDMISISSYSSNGNDYDSVLAHGTVANLVATASVRALGRLTGGFETNGVWQARFFGRSNWLYTLERTENFVEWTPASATLPGAEEGMTLQDSNPPSAGAFYRVRAE